MAPKDFEGENEGLFRLIIDILKRLIETPNIAVVIFNKEQKFEKWTFKV